MLGLGLLVAAAGSASADVYKYVGADGVAYYTDNPLHSGFRLLFKNDDPPPSAVKSRRSGVGKALARRIREFASLITTAASRYQLDPALLHAVIRAESGYNPAAVSHKGAVGLMQLMPETAARYGVLDSYDPAENIDGGARYLSDLLALFGDDLRLAVAAYNAGEGAVIKYGNQIPPYQETQTYVSRVLSYYRGLRGKTPG